MTAAKIAVVTGAGGGIGRAVTLRLLESGWRVVATDVREEALAAKHWPRKKIVRRVLDVTRADAIEQLFRELGPVDGLVNNAGIYEEASLFALSEERWMRTIDVNLNGAYRCLRAAAKTMDPKRGGRIVNIASIAGVTGVALASHYAASKAGMIALTRSAALELASARISVNAVLPGYVDTQMISKRRSTIERLAKQTVPRGRIGEAEEVAELVGFLMNAKTDYITGALFTIDGGLSSSAR